MANQQAFPKDITIDVNAKNNRWVLHSYVGRPDEFNQFPASLALEIGHDFSSDPDDFTKKVYMDGDEFTFVSDDEWESAYQNIHSHPETPEAESEAKKEWDKYIHDHLKESEASALWLSGDASGKDALAKFDEMIEHWNLLNKLVTFSVKR